MTRSLVSRRRLLKTASSTALLGAGTTALSAGFASTAPANQESRPFPNLALEINGKLAAAPFDEEGMMRIKQLGVNHVIMGGPKIPWDASEIRSNCCSTEGRGVDTRQHDDLGLSQHGLRKTWARRGDREGEAID